MFSKYIYQLCVVLTVYVRQIIIFGMTVVSVFHSCVILLTSTCYVFSQISQYDWVHLANPCMSATQDCIVKHSEIESIRTQTEREALEKNKLEDAVMEKMMQRLTMDKATQYTHKSVKTIRKKAKDYVS